MIVYRDLISGDEMLSDAFKLLPVVDDEGAVVSSLQFAFEGLPNHGLTPLFTHSI